MFHVSASKPYGPARVFLCAIIEIPGSLTSYQERALLEENRVWGACVDTGSPPRNPGVVLNS